MSNQHDPHGRIHDLLTTKAIEGLSAEEEREFQEIDWAAHSLDPDEATLQLEVSATAFNLAFAADEKAEDENMSLPPTLRDKILVSAGEFFATAGGQETGLNIEDAFHDRTETTRAVERSVIAPPSWREALSMLAAAACLFILIGSLNGLFNRPTPIETPMAARQKMDEFIATRPIDMVNVAWTENVAEGSDPLGITGEVVWSDSRQEGYMVFSGLPKNNPAVEQYQLWIFDTTTDQVAPTDGGVFDISKDGEVIIPIDAQHPVKNAVMFAVTIEQPGGVQRSSRERLPALAVVSK